MNPPPAQKRILIWSASYAPVIGGLQTIVSELALGLQKKGHQVQLLSNRIPSSLPSYEIINGLPVSRFRFFHPFRPVKSMKDGLLALYGILIFPVRLIQLMLFIQRFKPDVVNVHFPGQQIWFLGFLQHYFKKSKWIISLHGDEILQFFELNGNNEQAGIKQTLSLSEKIKLRVLKRRLLQSDGITACSAYLLNMTGQLFRTALLPGRVVHNGIDYSFFSHPQPRLLKKEYIFACGRLVYTKGFDLLIAAYASLPERERTRYSLVIAGTGAEKEKLVSLAIRLKIQNRVQFYGRTSPAETVALLQHSALTVVPSRRETFGMVLLEAMAAGVKVVATNVGGMPEIAQYGKVLLCEPAGDSLSGQMAIALGSQTDCYPPVSPGTAYPFSREIMLEKYEGLFIS